MNPTDLHEIVRAYRDGLIAALGDRLERLILYGSQARGDAQESSGTDLLCVMRGPFDYGDMIERTSELTAALSLEHDVVLSRTFVTQSEYETRQVPFLMSVRKEGAPLVD